MQLNISHQALKRHSVRGARRAGCSCIPLIKPSTVYAKSFFVYSKFQKVTILINSQIFSKSHNFILHSGLRFKTIDGGVPALLLFGIGLALFAEISPRRAGNVPYKRP